MARRILVVDDSRQSRKLVADVLGAEGYDVRQAASGAEALARVAEDEPDLVVLDVVMPEIDGFEVCKRLRYGTETALLPIIMVTAADPETERLRGIEAGADEFLSKPINYAELLARVRSLMRSRELHEKVLAQSAELAAWNKKLEERVATQVAALERLEHLKRFFPGQLAESISGGRGDLLEPHRRDVTIAHVRLEGFGELVEAAEPEEVLEVLRECHGELGRVVLDHEGTLERLAPESWVVLFNDPVETADPEIKAVRMAIAMGDVLDILRGRWSGPEARLGLAIGIASGYATLGAIGFDERWSYAAVGVPADVAARLCQRAEGGRILVSERVRAAVADRVSTRPAAGSGEDASPAAWEVLRTEATAASPAASPLPVESPVAGEEVFRLEGEYWTIRHGGRTLRLRDAKGLRYMSLLMRSPEREIHALELVRMIQGPSAPNVAADRVEALTVRRAIDEGEAVVDSRALRAYRERLEELRGELDDAQGCNDSGRAERAQHEIDELEAEISKAVGLGRRTRSSSSSSERARLSVTVAIKTALRRIAEQAPDLGRNLSSAVRTGAFCSYVPGTKLPRHWDL